MKKQLKTQKVQPQSEQLIQFRTTISNNYIETVLPYELMIQAIALQNKQIYNLQNQYKELYESTKNSLSQEKMQQRHRQFLDSRKKQKIMEMKNFMEEGLKANKKNDQNQFQKHKQQLSEQIKLKRDQIDMIKKNKVNIFVNFEEGLLGQLQEENNNNKEASQEVKNSLLSWKSFYERQVVNKKV